MSYNGSGTFVINSAGQPVVTGTVISSTAFNALTADLGTGLSTALTKDGQTTPTANIPMGTFKITGLGAGTTATDAVNLSQLQNSTGTFLTASGTNTITGTLNPALTAYSVGQIFAFVAAATNTSSATINISSLGAKNITRLGATALIAGDLIINSLALIVYDGTQFQLLNPNTFTNLTVTGSLSAASLAGAAATGTGSSGTWNISVLGNAATATNATNVALTTSSTSTAFKVPFANTAVSTTGNYDLLQDSTATFTYNPSTNTLTADTFSGALSGNATTATDSTQLGSVAAASYAQLGTTQTFTGAKTFTGNITSSAYNFAATTSFFLGGGGDIQLSIGGTTRFKVDTSGNIEISGSNATKASGTTWINPSDARLKDNVVSYTKGLNELVQIQPKSFTFNGKAGSVAGLNAIGIIADEIEQVLPNTVQKRLAKLNPNDAQETEIRYFDASELTWVMVNAIKEQQTIISAMETRLAALEA